MKKILFLSLVAVASFSLLGAQGEKVLIKEAVSVPAGSHSMEEAYLRFKKLCAGLGLSEPQMKNADALWKETARKLRATYDVKKMEGARREHPAQAVIENAEKRFSTLVTKMQRIKLAELLKVKPAMPEGTAEAKIKVDKASAAKVKCWSCWPGECDRRRGGVD